MSAHTGSTVTALDPTDLRALLSTPPSGFVAARNALVKRLRTAKDRESATAVASIHRPAWPEWALNVTSQSHADDVDAFADAAAAVRGAQAAAIEGRTADVRQALARLRDCSASVTRLANTALRNEGRPDETPQLRTLLSRVAADPETVEQLRNGVLGSAEAGTTDQFADLQVAPRSPRSAPDRRPAAARSTPDVAPERAAQPESDPPAVSAAERRELMRGLAAAERELQRSKRALTKAEAAVDGAADVVAHAEEQLAAARQLCDESSATVARDEAARDGAASALDATS